MTTPDTAEPDNAAFGRGVVDRLRVPGPPRIRRRPAWIGSVASSSARFAAGTARPVAVRRMLGGPEVVTARSYRDAYVAPPRWWTPAEPEPDAASVAPPAQTLRRSPGQAAALPARGLPKAVRRVPNEQTYTPGGIVAGLHAEVINVRRSEATVAAGPMLMNHDRQRLAPSRDAAKAAKPPARGGPPEGNPAGSGLGPGVGSATPVVPGAGVRQSAPAATAPTASPTATAAGTPAAHQTAHPAHPQPSAAASGSGGATPSRPAPIVSRFLSAVRRTATEILPTPVRRSPAATVASERRTLMTSACSPATMPPGV